jgi:hypothetical protein
VNFRRYSYILILIHFDFNYVPQNTFRKGTNAKVEAAPDPWGLQVGVGYRLNGNVLDYQLFFCGNGATLNVYKLDNEGRYEADGCEAKGVHSIELDSDTGNFFKDTLNWTTENIVPLVPDIINAATLEASLGDWVGCVNSYQCANQCCSGKYSDNVLKCTPVGGFKDWEGCIGSARRYLRKEDTFDGFVDGIELN